VETDPDRVNGRGLRLAPARCPSRDRPVGHPPGRRTSPPARVL